MTPPPEREAANLTRDPNLPEIWRGIRTHGNVAPRKMRAAAARFDFIGQVQPIPSAVRSRAGSAPAAPISAQLACHFAR